MKKTSENNIFACNITIHIIPGDTQEVFGPKQDLSAPGNGYLVHFINSGVKQIKEN